ncbi:hypothetical protein HDU98_001609 [Podochytrium sp. JEL0797]|nr:hypothetical protein HDU98_001609 [Podochytrium sp. JEL0797]
MLFSNALSAFAAATLVCASPVDQDTNPGPHTLLPSDARLQHVSTLQAGSSRQPSRTAASLLINYGGPVIPNVVVQPLWYGTPVYQSDLTSFYAGVTNSAWFKILAQYHVQTGTGKRGINITGTTLTTLDDTKDIQPMLIAMVNAGTITPTANTYFPIHFGPGISITQGGGGSCTVFCAYHGTIDISTLKNAGTKYLMYGVIPDQGGKCAGVCGSNPIAVNNLFSVSSHELAEAVTDPAVGVCTVYAPPLGWYSSVYGEIGDICNAQQGTTVGIDGNSYVIQKLYSNSAKACVSS